MFTFFGWWASRPRTMEDPDEAEENQEEEPEIEFEAEDEGEDETEPGCQIIGSIAICTEGRKHQEGLTEFMSIPPEEE